MFSLHRFNNQDNPYTDLLLEDPVRPHIPLHSRFAHNRGIFVLTEDQHSIPQAVCCYVLMGAVPKDEDELLSEASNFNVAVFYTVWARPGSTKGSGRALINTALNHIRWFVPFCDKAVTLSPKTEMAERFHLSNHATLFRENESTINYEYTI